MSSQLKCFDQREKDVKMDAEEVKQNVLVASGTKAKSEVWKSFDHVYNKIMNRWVM